MILIPNTEVWRVQVLLEGRITHESLFDNESMARSYYDALELPGEAVLAQRAPLHSRFVRVESRSRPVVDDAMRDARLGVIERFGATIVALEAYIEQGMNREELLRLVGLLPELKTLACRFETATAPDEDSDG